MCTNRDNLTLFLLILSFSSSRAALSILYALNSKLSCLPGLVEDILIHVSMTALVFSLRRMGSLGWGARLTQRLILES